MAKREPSQAQRNAIKKHDTEVVDKVTVRLPKGTKDAILATGDSANHFIIDAVREKLGRDKADGKEKEKIAKTP